MLNATTEMKKWAPVLEHADAPAFRDDYRKQVTAKLLENTEKALTEENNQSNFLSENNQTAGAVSNYDPVLISLVRRAMPNLIAYDVAGVQPMSGPTGLIFAMKSRMGSKDSPGSGLIDTNDAEAFFTEPNTDFSTGNGSGANANFATADETDPAFGTSDASPDTIDEVTNFSSGVSRRAGEQDFFNDMGFTIEKSTVTAVTRGLKAEYTMELAQDLKAIHGLDAESELANILSTEILGEINREVIRSINSSAELGARKDDVQGASANRGTTNTGTFSLTTDADGRWSGEKFKSLLTQIQLECNTVAKRTRRGKGNYVICSSNVASALAATGNLDYQHDGLNVDDTANTFAGTLTGGIKVYIDPYAITDYATVGYKGASPYDAGLFYCPYVPLTMVRAIDEQTFQPKIGFKTRYGMIANPFASGDGATITDGSLGPVRANRFFRIFRVQNINVEDA
tara:strand:+ start:2751 stop:4118 length:1368 start_codon:yes stop_codon:yes gene_type:complete